MCDARSTLKERKREGGADLPSTRHPQLYEEINKIFHLDTPRCYTGQWVA